MGSGLVLNRNRSTPDAGEIFHGAKDAPSLAVTKLDKAMAGWKSVGMKRCALFTAELPFRQRKLQADRGALEPQA